MEEPDWEDELIHAYDSCKEALVMSQHWVNAEPKASTVIERTLKMMMRVEQDLEGDQTPEVLRGLVTAYLELFQLRGGAEVAHVEAAAKVREASRHLRDAVVSSCFGLMESDDREEFLNLLVEASDNQIGAPGADGENLKSSLLKACHALYGNLPSSEPTKARRKRASRARSKQRAAIAREEQAFLEEQYMQFQMQIWYRQMAVANQAAAAHSMAAAGEMAAAGAMAGSMTGGASSSSSSWNPWPVMPQLPHDQNAFWPEGMCSDASFMQQASAGSLGVGLNFSTNAPGTDFSAMYPQLPAPARVDNFGMPETCEPFDLMPRTVNVASSTFSPDIPPGLESILEADEVQEDAIASMQLEDERAAALQNRLCVECQAEDADGWPDRWQRYYCTGCWKDWNEQKEDDVITRFDKLDPVVQDSDVREATEVLVMETDALDLARCNFHGSCLVVFGPEDLPSERNSDSRLFFERTNFKDLTKNYLDTVPRWGGLYARQVSVQKDASLGKLPKATSIATIYAAAPWGPNMVTRSMGSEEGADSLAEWSKDWDRFRKEVREKIKNVLRTCYNNGHDEVIVMMADACFADAPAAEIAAQWRECLLGPGFGDTPGLVRRLVFAMPFGQTLIKAKLAFQREFRSLDPLKPVSACSMIVLDGTKLCMDARDLMKATEVSHPGAPNGIKVILKPISITAAQEHQLWLHLPCGRLVLAAYPELCLSAVSNSTDGVHLWKRVEEQNTDLQIWQRNSDDTLSLAEHPKMILTVTATNTLSLEVLPDTKDNQVWRIMNADQAIQLLGGA
eukprot:TRINITY_DN24307_c0_g2_i1.p1 TRINITY_DN24307_c0_g2~~TRINITY_DN24307_c0_g2_i1.p1  ORF type:complete len:813 (+),score=195.40 TRINITY_DN24307_c0_g2_i1:60-2441(+)